ncbi:MAG: uracil-DNA glycosylase [Caldilineaceae bacterium]|nr:uracil-DNA glycosylase [Caldilineaceae bacterium]
MTTATTPAGKTYQTLADLVAAMQQMDDDPLYVTGSTMVIYRGNPAAELMIVGEAPGPQENKQGKPFVGPSGKLLDQILNSVGLESEKDIFITNAVFRLPPGADNRAVRKPTTAEIQFYKPFLMEIIRLIDPKIILLTGAVSMQALLNETKLGITKMRGQWFQVDDRWVMPIFHPAYLLRNPEKSPGSPKALMWQDIQAVRRKYDELGLASAS